MPRAMYFLSTPTLCFILLFSTEGQPRVLERRNVARSQGSGCRRHGGGLGARQGQASGPWDLRSLVCKMSGPE